jgi:hypothetical protein
MTSSSDCSHEDNTTLYNVFSELTMCRTQQYINLQWINTAKAVHTVNTQKHSFHIVLVWQTIVCIQGRT